MGPLLVMVVAAACLELDDRFLAEISIASLELVV